MRWWVTALLAVILSGGIWTRVAAFQQARGHLQLGSDCGLYISMAENLRYGVGLYAPSRVREFDANPYAYRAQPPPPRSELVEYYENDLGLSLLYALAIRLFANSDSPVVLLVKLQLLVDCLNILVMFVVGRTLRGNGLGLIAAFVYSGFGPIYEMAAQRAFYHYWSACFALWNMALWMALHPKRSPLWGTAYGILVGLAAMVRSTFLPLGGVVSLHMLWRWRRKAVVWMAAILIGQALVSGPVQYRLHARLHQWTMPRFFWHNIYVGLGARPNPYGIVNNDDSGFRFAAAHGIRFAAAHGIQGNDPDSFIQYENLLRSEVMRIQHETPWLIPRNILLNLIDGFTCNGPPMHVGWLSLQTTLPPLAFQRGLLILCAVAYSLCYLPLRTSVPLLQGVYFVFCVSAITLPVGIYNAGYLPTFALLLAILAFGYGHALYLLWRLQPASPSRQEIWLAVAVGSLLPTTGPVLLVLVAIHSVVSQGTAARTILWNAVAIYFALFSFFSVQNYRDCYFGNLDYGIANQSFWTTVHGQGFFYNTVEGTSHLAVHNSLIYLLLLPIYWAFPSVGTLLIAQSAALGLGAVMVYLLGRHLVDEQCGLLLGVSYLLSPCVHAIGYQGFHEVSFALAPLLLAFYGLYRKQWRWMWTGVLLTLACGQDMALVTIMFGLYVAMQAREHRQTGLALVLVSVAWFAISQHFHQAVDWQRYGYLRNSMVELVATSIRHPLSLLQILFTRNAIIVFLELMIPLAFLPLRGARVLMVASLLWVGFMAAQGADSAYLAPILACVFMAAVVGLKDQIRALHFARLVLVLSLLAMLTTDVTPMRFPFQNAASASEHVRQRDSLLDSIPSQASVSTQTEFYGKLSSRLHVYVGYQDRVDFILVDPTIPLSYGYAKWPEILPRLVSSGTYRQLREADGAQLFVRSTGAGE